MVGARPFWHKSFLSDLLWHQFEAYRGFIGYGRSKYRAKLRCADQPSSSYGAVGPPGLANGVTTAERLQTKNEGVDNRGVENPNLLDQPPLREPQGDARQVLPATQPVSVHTEPPYEEPHRNANVKNAKAGMTDAVAHVAPADPTGAPMTPASSTVRVQEYYTAETRSTTAEQQGVRWMTRDTEFLQRTASRGATGVERVLDGLGIPVHPETVQAPRYAPQRPRRRSLRCVFST